jgi:uncharacterized 2Fe-2S/4Fe-4S cluster protein (DUF4445 family)
MAESITIKILPEGLSVQARPGELLGEVLTRAAVPLNRYCGGRGLCGKCLVRIVSGPLPLLEGDEKALLEARSLTTDHRLSCRYEIRAPATVEILPGSRAAAISVLDAGFCPPLTVDPAVKSFSLEIPSPSLASPRAVLDSLRDALGLPHIVAPLSVVKDIRLPPKNGRFSLTVCLYGENEILDIETGKSEEDLYGLAVDLGTSTVVAELLSLVSGKTLSRAVAPNSQITYGADVVSRLSFSFQNSDNLERLRNSILQLLNGLVSELVAKAAVPRNRICEAVIAANTAMNHILCGVAVDSLALSPFHAVFSRLDPFPASELGLGLHPRAKAYVVPNIKSFIGGDITAGLAASGFAERPGNGLFLDLGTNGEIVLRKGKHLYATSTAAGPAFEGMSLSCGMLAVPGAVQKAGWDDGFDLKTIDGLPAQGLCGTGLVDIVALSLRQGLLGPDGKITAPGRKIVLTKSLSLTQQDIREIQLAVGAVKTGVRMILREFGVSPGRLDEFLIAGAFGSSLDVENAGAVGLIPDVPADAVTFLGNSSLAGARKLLLSAPDRAAAEGVARRIEHVSLASRASFQDEFVGAMTFGR